MPPAGALQLAFEARDLPGLFDRAAREVMAKLVVPETVTGSNIRERVVAEAEDRAALFAAWLRQVLFLYVRQQEILTRFEIRRLTDRRVEADALGELLDPGRHGVIYPSAELTESALAPVSAGWSARITLQF